MIVYIQCLPGCGKSTVVQAMRTSDIRVVDGDDYVITDVNGNVDCRATFEVLSLLDCDVVLWSGWFHLALDLKSFIFGGYVWKERDCYIEDVLGNRQDLFETFGADTLAKWVDDYEMFHLYTSATTLYGDAKGHRLGSDEYLSVADVLDSFEYHSLKEM